MYSSLILLDRGKMEIINRYKLLYAFSGVNIDPVKIGTVCMFIA